MSLEKDKAMVRKVNEALNKRDLSGLDEFMAEDYVDHTNQLHGLEDVRRWYARIFKDFSAYHRTIEDMVAEGDKVWVRFRTTGTSAASGKKIDLITVSMLRMVNGKAVEGQTVPKVAGEFYKKLL